MSNSRFLATPEMYPQGFPNIVRRVSASLVVVTDGHWFDLLVPILPSGQDRTGLGLKLLLCLGNQPARQAFIELAKNASKFLIL